MIDYSVNELCATIEVDDLTPLSRHDERLATDLRDAMVEAGDDDDVKVILLRSGAEDFCADVPAADASPPDRAEIWTTFNQSFTTSNTLYQSMCFSKKVILSQISGVCAGAGSMLVLCSDLSVAAQGSTFGSPFDVLPESNFVLAALTIRLNRAKAWLLRGDAMSASEALDFGLVNRIVPADKLALVSTELARSVSMPMDGIAMSKMLLQSVLDSHGVGREFDMAGFYAGSFWEGGHVG